VLAIVGNKVDLEKQEVNYEEANSYAEELGAFLKYTSAKDGKGVEELFLTIA
jgi:GTPase SAR1 family protein